MTLNTDVTTAVEAHQKALTAAGIRSKTGTDKLGLSDTNYEKNKDAFKRTSIRGLIKAILNADEELMKLYNND